MIAVKSGWFVKWFSSEPSSSSLNYHAVLSVRSSFFPNPVPSLTVIYK